ncbi:MAG: hypothetical protein CVU53_05210, partial [Deltaproteobacteria bacterium HGW-Deltaproteobacteria-11]
RRITPALSIAGGVGMNKKGPQGSLMPRLEAGSGRFVAGVGLGLSVGGMTSFEEEMSADPVERGTELGLFCNGEVFVRVRFTRFFVGVFAGYSRLLSELEKPDDTSNRVQKNLGFGGLEWGMTF